MNLKKIKLQFFFLENFIYWTILQPMAVVPSVRQIHATLHSVETLLANRKEHSCKRESLQESDNHNFIIQSELQIDDEAMKSGKYTGNWKHKTEHSKTCVRQPLKITQNNVLNDEWYLNEGKLYRRMLPLEHSAIDLTCIRLYLVLKTNFQSFLRVAVLHRFDCICWALICIKSMWLR